MVGTITRGTTNPNRLRRCDRWLVATQAWRLRSEPDPVAVDLGYGASPVTTVEWAARLSRVAPDVRVVGLEIDPDRVAAARPLEAPGLTFAAGGFEVPLAAGRTAAVIRAFNVLRQYAEADVPGAWERLRGRLSPAGLVIDGTCDELGRRATWVALDRDGPQSLTIALRLADVDQPSEVAERLPKALIHRNVPGERVHAYLGALDAAWARAAPLSAYGRRQRFVATVRDLRDAGWPVLGGVSRWRLGEVTVAWEAVAPGGVQTRL
ncbi:MAG: class I SAM-dependent methyltransferase [Austwickia sp.]|jgi:hypothetical protein|nr:MAG: class I SAM-dependent methyltransferase [Austwickia sp.]